MEEIAMEDENAMESFLETGRIAGEQIREMIVQRKIFPCFFGSALRNAGVDTFLQGFDRYTLAPEYPDEFGMKVFKIARDEANNRLTYLKVTGGTLKVKSPLSNADLLCNGFIECSSIGILFKKFAYNASVFENQNTVSKTCSVCIMCDH